MNIHGFINHNSICYLNSILQCLLSCSKFVKYIVKIRDEYTQNNNKLGEAFLKLILKNAKNDPETPYMSMEINKIMNINGQQCASEMLLKLIDDLKLEKLFEQKIEKSLYCMNCNKIVSVKYDIAYIHNYTDSENNNDDSNKKINMNFNCIDDYNCDKCKKKTKLIMLNSLEKTSDIFVISFNKYIKKDIVNYPHILSLTNKKNKYKLVGIINHHGNIMSGHYWAEVIRNNNFYNVDDTSVQKINSFNNLKDNFILFYEKI